MIKEVSLKHNVNILTKNKLREQDMEELKDKAETHKKIMEIDNKEEWELDKGLYRKVLKRIKNCEMHYSGEEFLFSYHYSKQNMKFIEHVET